MHRVQKPVSKLHVVRKLNKLELSTCDPSAQGGCLENIYTGMLKVDFRMLTISIPVYCKKNTRSLYLTCMTKPTHLYTIFTEMMTHYYHFHQQNSPSSYHHRNKGSLINTWNNFKTTPLLVYQNWWKCTSKPLSIPVHHVLGSIPPGLSVGWYLPV